MNHLYIIAVEHSDNKYFVSVKNNLDFGSFILLSGVHEYFCPLC